MIHATQSLSTYYIAGTGVIKMHEDTGSVHKELVLLEMEGKWGRKRGREGRRETEIGREKEREEEECEEGRKEGQLDSQLTLP
jgi:hypothetical protein